MLSKEQAFQKKKFIHFDRNSQTSSRQLQQMAVQKIQGICLWLIRLCKRLWEFEIELSLVLIPHRWEWSHLHVAEGLTVVQICRVIRIIDQEVIVEIACRASGKKLQVVDVWCFQTECFAPINKICFQNISPFHFVSGKCRSMKPDRNTSFHKCFAFS